MAPSQSLHEQVKAITETLITGGVKYHEAIREYKKQFITNMLIAYRGNQCQAAAELGMHRNTLFRTIQELKIDLRALMCEIRAKKRPGSIKPALLQRRA
jgi:DNA-binding NtrC family response regulator